LGAVAIPRIIGFPASLNLARESESFWEGAWAWTVSYDLHFWVPMLLLAIGMLVVDLGPHLSERFASLWHNKELFSKLMQEHDDEVSSRERYWKISKDIYGSPADVDSLFRKLGHLIEAADVPDIDLFHPDINTWSNSLSGPSKELWGHVCWAQSQIAEDADELMSLQAKISNYWHKVGAAIFEEKQISRNKVFDRHFPHQSRLLKLILYMELCVDLDLESTKIRKPYAFKLYDKAYKARLTYERKRELNGARQAPKA